MTEEEVKTFVRDINITLAHTDQLTAELLKHLEFMAKMFTNFVDEFNK